MKKTIQAPNSDPGIKNWIIRLIKGALIGIGGILPGLSGGVLSVIFGIYRPMINFLSNIKENFLNNVKYFIPVGIGGLVGVLIFSVFVEKAFGKYSAQFVCLFIGFVVGTFPSLYKEAGKKGRSKGDLITMSISCILIFSLMFMGKDFPQIEPSTPIWFIAGAIVALGFIVPGMSPSNFLIYFGLYDKMARGIASIDIAMLIPFVIGMLITILSLSKLANSLFKTKYSKMYHGVLGMVIGSSLGIFPAIIFPSYSPEGLLEAGLSFSTAAVFGTIMFIIGVVVSYRFSKLEEKVSYE